MRALEGRRGMRDDWEMSQATRRTTWHEGIRGRRRAPSTHLVLAKERLAVVNQVREVVLRKDLGVGVGHCPILHRVSIGPVLHLLAIPFPRIGLRLQMRHETGGDQGTSDGLGKGGAVEVQRWTCIHVATSSNTVRSSL